MSFLHVVALCTPTDIICHSELAEPHKLLSYLLQQRIVSLSSDIIAVYLHAAMKVFGSWAAELADRWDDDDLLRVRNVVDDVLERLASFVTHTDIEVQERVSAASVATPAVTHLRPLSLLPPCHLPACRRSMP